MRAPLRSLGTFKSLVAPPSPRATAKLDPRWRGEGPARGAAESAAEPPERQTGGPPAASETRAPRRPSRVTSGCASRPESGLGLSGPCGGEIPHRPHPSGAGGREGGAPDLMDSWLDAGCPPRGLAHSRALWTLGAWVEGRVGRWRDVCSRSHAHQTAVLEEEQLQQ